MPRSVVRMEELVKTQRSGFTATVQGTTWAIYVKPVSLFYVHVE